MTLTSAGVRPPPAADDDPGSLDGRRLGQLGRSAQDLLGALDQAPETASGTAAYVTIGSRFLRGWAVELLLVALLVPVLAATVDLFARLRRRHVSLGPALRSLRSRLTIWLWIGLVFAFFSFVGLFPSGAPDAYCVQIETFLRSHVSRPRLQGRSRPVASNVLDALHITRETHTSSSKSRGASGRLGSFRGRPHG